MGFCSRIQAGIFNRYFKKVTIGQNKNSIQTFFDDHFFDCFQDKLHISYKETMHNVFSYLFFMARDFFQLFSWDCAKLYFSNTLQVLKNNKIFFVFFFLIDILVFILINIIFENVRLNKIHLEKKKVDEKNAQAKKFIHEKREHNPEDILTFRTHHTDTEIVKEILLMLTYLKDRESFEILLSKLLIKNPNFSADDQQSNVQTSILNNTKNQTLSKSENVMELLIALIEECEKFEMPNHYYKMLFNKLLPLVHKILNTVFFNERIEEQLLIDFRNFLENLG